MEKTNKRNPLYLVVGLILIVTAIVLFLVYSDTVKDTVECNDRAVEEFYEPYWINDTTMHLNVSESTCLLFEIENDTCYISANNIEHVVIDNNTITVYYHEGKEFKQKEIYLDSIDGFNTESVYVN